MFGMGEPPPDHCEQCKDEYERRQREYLLSMYGYGYVRKKPQKSLAEADPRKFLDRLVELQRRVGEEEPTHETLSTVELPKLEELTKWDCPFCFRLANTGDNCASCGNPRMKTFT